MRCRWLTFVIVVLPCLAMAQGKPPGTKSKAPQTQIAEPVQKSNAPAPQPVEVSPDTPVITIPGLCEQKPPAATPSAKDTGCKTVVTRAEFEKVESLINPNMAPAARADFANGYSRLLVISSAAHDRGLDQTQRFADLMRSVRMQVLATDFVRTLREEAKATPQQVENYYKEHQQQYEEASFKRLFIPKNRLDEKAKPDPAVLKAEADRIRERAAADEDFDTLEKEIYDKAGLKTPPPPTGIPNWRRQAAPASQAQVFDLQPGQLSPIIDEPGGLYIYRLESKRVLPLEQVRAEIETTLSNDKFRSELESILSRNKPELNEAYFGKTSGIPSLTPVPPRTPQSPVSPEEPKAGSTQPPAKQPK